MRECWINVYIIRGIYQYGCSYGSAYEADNQQSRLNQRIYRIHVRMK